MSPYRAAVQIVVQKKSHHQEIPASAAHWASFQAKSKLKPHTMQR